MKKWIMDEYNNGVAVIKRQLKTAKSKIHLSFDVWTAPNGTPILGVAAHFLTSEMTLKHPLLALEVFAESHTAEKMAEVLQRVLLEWELDAVNVGVFIGDNLKTNDACVKVLVRQVFDEFESPKAHRARCVAHIINLVAQAFIYGKKNEAFVIEAEQLKNIDRRDLDAVTREQRLWRSRGSFGKFHNVVKYIRGSAQRGLRFRAMIQVEVDRRQRVVGNDVGKNERSSVSLQILSL
jgi:hypothetical protein